MSLKQKTVSGLSWSLIDNISAQGIQFVVGIVLARLLSPRDFGLIGIITIFLVFLQLFIDTGFREALIRKKNCSTEDYCTAFYSNASLGIFFYVLLFFSAKTISAFFKQPELFLLTRVIGIILIIDAFTLIQRTILSKNINFKLQTKISIISYLVSGVSAIIMAYKGCGVWSLVAKTLIQDSLQSVMLWSWNKWRPAALFSRASFKDLFGFSSKVLGSSLVETTYQQVFGLAIGKYFSMEELGFFTRANLFRNIPLGTLNTVVQRVTIPVLASIQDESERLKEAYKRIIKSVMLMTFVVMAGLAAVAKPLIVTLIGSKWMPAVPYLQLLCFSGMFYPLYCLNSSILTVKGRSDLMLIVATIKNILAIPTIIIGVFFGIKIMLVGIILDSLVAYSVNSSWSGRLINYPVKEQIADLFPSFVLALFMGVIVAIPGYIWQTKPIFLLLVQVGLGAIIAIGLSEVLRLDGYLEIKDIVVNRLSQNSAFAS